MGLGYREVRRVVTAHKPCESRVSLAYMLALSQIVLVILHSTGAVAVCFHLTCAKADIPMERFKR